MENKNKRKSIIYLVIGIITLVALIAGATYAYFQAVTSNGANVDINVGSGTIDNLFFTKGSDIALNVTQDNLSEEGGQDVSEETNVTATLMANNTTNEAQASYNVFFIIDKNDFEYTIEGTPEIIIKVKGGTIK